VGFPVGRIPRVGELPIGVSPGGSVGGVAVAVLVFARPIVAVFVDGSEVLARAVAFVRVTSPSLVGAGVDNAVTGILRRNGDTRWPLYGKVAYVTAIPVAALATSLVGITAVYALLVVGTVFPALFVFYRFWTGRRASRHLLFRQVDAPPGRLTPRSVLPVRTGRTPERWSGTAWPTCAPDSARFS